MLDSFAFCVFKLQQLTSTTLLSTRFRGFIFLTIKLRDNSSPFTEIPAADIKTNTRYK